MGRSFAPSRSRGRSRRGRLGKATSPSGWRDSAAPSTSGGRRWLRARRPGWSSDRQASPGEDVVRDLLVYLPPLLDELRPAALAVVGHPALGRRADVAVAGIAGAQLGL